MSTANHPKVPFSPGVLRKLAAELTERVAAAEVTNSFQQDEHVFWLVLAGPETTSSLVLSLHKHWPGVFLESTVPRKFPRARDYDFSPLAGTVFNRALASATSIRLLFSGAEDAVYTLTLSPNSSRPTLDLQPYPQDAAGEATSLSQSAVADPVDLVESPQSASSSPEAHAEPVRVCYLPATTGPDIPLFVQLSTEGCPPGYRERSFSSANEAVRTFVLHGLHRHRFEELQALLEKTLKKRLKKVKRRITNLEQDLEEARQADRYRAFANLLLANPGGGRKGESSVTLPAFDGLGTVTIPLDPRKTRVENAQEYYRKARKLDAKAKIAAERLDQARAEKRQLEVLLLRAKEADSLRALRALVQDEAPELLDKDRRANASAGKSRATEAKRPFLEFVSEDGLQILAGRSAEANERLTFQVAKEHDFWFHAAGVSGSHVIVRNPRRLEKCPPRTTKQAAALAAYLSKNRNSSNVLVHYTQRRYLKKAKGAPPGTVIMKAFQSIFVKPALPEQPQDGTAG